MLPQELVSKYPTSQAQAFFCSKLTKTECFDNIISLVQTNIKPSIISEIRDDKVKYVEKRLFPQIKYIRILNNIIENFQIYWKAKSSSYIWINNLNPQLLLSYYLLRLFSRAKIFSILTDFTPPTKTISLAGIMERTIYTFDGVISLSSRSTFNFKNVACLPGIVLNYKKKSPELSFYLRKKLLFSGALTSITGIDLILETISKTPGIQLIVSGRGDLEDKVLQYSSKFENIKYYGFLDKESYDKILEEVDVCLSLRNPGLEENRNNFPSKILEYLSCSKIVISTIKYPELDGVKYFFSQYSNAGLKETIDKVFSLSPHEILEYMDNEQTLMNSCSITAWERTILQVEQQKQY